MGVSRYIPAYPKRDGTVVFWSKRARRWVRLPAREIHPDDLAAMRPQERQQVLAGVENRWK
jgi:hypothetical protein